MKPLKGYGSIFSESPNYLESIGFTSRAIGVEGSRRQAASRNERRTYSCEVDGLVERSLPERYGDTSTAAKTPEQNASFADAGTAAGLTGQVIGRHSAPSRWAEIGSPPLSVGPHTGSGNQFSRTLPVRDKVRHGGRPSSLTLTGTGWLSTFQGVWRVVSARRWGLHCWLR